jgi:hypothetical protein
MSIKYFFNNSISGQFLPEFRYQHCEIVTLRVCLLGFVELTQNRCWNFIDQAENGEKVKVLCTVRQATYLKWHFHICDVIEFVLLKALARERSTTLWLDCSAFQLRIQSKRDANQRAREKMFCTKSLDRYLQGRQGFGTERLVNQWKTGWEKGHRDLFWTIERLN